MASARPRNQQEQGSGERRRILRIGLILGGKIVEERLIRERTAVTVGQSARNMFAVPVDGLPREWQLFTLEGDKYFLNFTDAMDGRLSDDKDVRTLASLKGKEAQQRGKAWVVPLDEHTSRGKIVLGEMTLLFQFVAEPPRQPKPHLPASVRGSLADRIDPMLAIIMAISLLLHFSVGLYAYQRDRVVRKRTARIFNETFQRPTVAVEDIRIPPPEQPKTDEGAAQAKEDKPPAQADSKPRGDGNDNKPKGDGNKPSGGTRSAEEAMALEEEAMRYASTLLGEDFSSSGIGGGSSGRDPKNDLGDAIDDIRNSGARVEIGGGAGGRGTRGDSGDSQIGTGQGPRVEGPGETTTGTGGKTEEKVPRGRVKIGGGSSDDDTTLKPDDILRKIQTVYMSGLKRCHKDLLKRDPTAGGTVSLRFTVGESGRVVRAEAKGFDSGVDRCIEGLTQGWRFGVPKDSDGEATDATFKISLVLQPD